MIIRRQEDVTKVVTEAFKDTQPPRLREILISLVTHLHAFARDVHLTEEEFERAVQYVARLGQKTDEKHNEVVLMSGSLGFSTLICLLNNGNKGHEGRAYGTELPPADKDAIVEYMKTL